MAQAFLATHGIDLQSELESIQNPSTDHATAAKNNDNNDQQHIITNVTLPNTSHPSDITITSSTITSIAPHEPTPSHNGKNNTLKNTPSSSSAALLAPSLCHPHIHLDKPYLLTHPRYAATQTLKEGTFAEAMRLTSAAKKCFTHEDLLERGGRLLDESISAGVTHVRAFVEVDAVVGRKCLDAGLELKRKVEVEGKCRVQICAFAQVPIFSPSEGDAGNGKVARGMMLEAVRENGVEVIGSTPYVESDRERMEENVQWMVGLAIEKKVHLDFHLDYNLDAEQEAMVWFVVKTLKSASWTEVNPGRTIVLGHCTRLSLFTDDEWKALAEAIGSLPISFVGLPTSDLFMMRTPERTRGTLDVPTIIKQHGLNACIGINNIGNAFTPQGSCDPLSLACSCVGIYSAGTKADAELLYECVSTRAREAIGFGRTDTSGGGRGRVGIEVKEGDEANLVLFSSSEREAWRTRRDVSEAVYLYDHCKGRHAILEGRRVA